MALFAALYCGEWVTKVTQSSVPVRLSDDAGLYFCEFQLFLSLARLYQKKESQRAEFLQVPKETDETAIARGVEVASALLIELVTDMEQEGSAARMVETQKNC